MHLSKKITNKWGSKRAKHRYWFFFNNFLIIWRAEWRSNAFSCTKVADAIFMSDLYKYLAQDTCNTYHKLYMQQYLKYRKTNSVLNIPAFSYIIWQFMALLSKKKEDLWSELELKQLEDGLSVFLLLYLLLLALTATKHNQI